MDGLGGALAPPQGFFAMVVKVERHEALVGRRILVIEDEVLLAMEMIDDLEEIGAVPFGPVPSVSGALEVLRSSQRFDAALINVHLRGEASFDVADALIARKIPFLFVTGNDGFVKQHYPDVPAHPKPSDMPVLIKALGDLLARTVRDGIR